MTLLTWLGILVCLSQSAMLSGLNLGLFSLNKLELQVEANKGDPRARRVLHIRNDANFALATILWGNVSVNVLLALLSGSVMSGVLAFFFSTVVITIFAEIIPQSYFTRHALRMASLLAPLLRFYQLALWPVARLTSLVLDRWLGGENMRFFPERDLRKVIQLHMESAESDIAHVEGQGALNFLEIDDVPLAEEGEPVDPDSVLRLEFDGDRPLFPSVQADIEDAFLRAVNDSGKSWAVIVDTQGEPRLLLRTEDFIREALFAPGRFNPHRHCHRPIIARGARETLGGLIQRFRVDPRRPGDDIIDDDVILLWGAQPRIVTGTDILGRLLRGIAQPAPHSPGPAPA
jgi:metal transporter CNNM